MRGPGGCGDHARSPPALPAATQQAIAAWRDSSDYGRCQLVKTYLQAVGGFGEAEVVKRVEVPAGLSLKGGPLAALQAWAEQLSGGGQDPFFAVVAHKL